MERDRISRDNEVYKDEGLRERRWLKQRTLVRRERGKTQWRKRREREETLVSRGAEEKKLVALSCQFATGVDGDHLILSLPPLYLSYHWFLVLQPNNSFQKILPHIL